MRIKEIPHRLHLAIHLFTNINFCNFQPKKHGFYLHLDADIVPQQQVSTILLNLGVPLEEIRTRNLFKLNDSITSGVLILDQMPLLAVTHGARLSRLGRSRIARLLGRLRRRRLHGSRALDADTDIISRPKGRAVLADLGVPLVEVCRRDVFVADDAVAGGAGTDFMPLGAVAHHAGLGWLGGLGVACGRWLGGFGGGCAGDAHAVVVVCEEAGAVALDGGIPLDEVGRGECAVGGDNLVAGVAGLGLVEILAGLDDAGLGGRGTCGRG